MSVTNTLQSTTERAIQQCLFNRFIFIFAVNTDFVDELSKQLGSALLVCDAQLLSLERIRQSIARHVKGQKKIIRPLRNTATHGEDASRCVVKGRLHAKLPSLMQCTIVLVQNADVGGVQKPSTETLIQHIEGAAGIARCVANGSLTFVMIGLADDRSLHVTSPAAHITMLASKSNRKAGMQAIDNALKAQFGKGSHPLAIFIQSLIDAREKDIHKSVMQKYPRYTEKMVDDFMSNYMYKNFIGSFAWKADSTNVDDIINDAFTNIQKNQSSILVIHGPAGCGKSWRINDALSNRYPDLKCKPCTTIHSFNNFSDTWSEDDQVVHLKVAGPNKGYIKSMLHFFESRIICLVVELTHPKDIDPASLKNIFEARGVFGRCEALQSDFSEHIRRISLGILPPACVLFMSKYMHSYSMLPSEAEAVLQSLRAGDTACISIEMVKCALEKMHTSNFFDRSGYERMLIQMAAQQTMQERSFKTGYSLYCSSTFQERLRMHDLGVDAAEANDVFYCVQNATQMQPKTK